MLVGANIRDCRQYLVYFCFVGVLHCFFLYEKKRYKFNTTHLSIFAKALDNLTFWSSIGLRNRNSLLTSISKRVGSPPSPPLSAHASITCLSSDHSSLRRPVKGHRGPLGRSPLTTRTVRGRLATDSSWDKRNRWLTLLVFLPATEKNFPGVGKGRKSRSPCLSTTLA